ncbi:glutamate racemase [Patescibacteria group bacterium]|nr:glutamate racemase [Patescibacteria group bacterium]
MVGIFDSGVGGLTVAKAVLGELPSHAVVYFGDTARVPYGSKSKELVVQYSKEITEFLLSKKADVIVVGCHTASALASDELKRAYPKIPIFDVIKPGLVAAYKATKNKKIGIIGTEGTIAAEVHEKMLKQMDPSVKVFTAACPLLVSLAEEGWVSKPETKRIIKFYLRKLKAAQVDTLVLACTHYPILLKDIESFMSRRGKKITTIDPGVETAKELKLFLEKNPEYAKEKAENVFYVSDYTPRVDRIAKMIFKKPISFKKADLKTK